MNILFIKYFFIGFMVYEVPSVSIFGHCPYSVTFPLIKYYNYSLYRDYISILKESILFICKHCNVYLSTTIYL